MNPEDELKAQLEKELEELRKATERYREAELEERRERFEQPIGEFDKAWQEKINQEEKAELRGASVAAKEAAYQLEKEKIDARRDADRQVLPPMGRDDREYLWHAERRGEPKITPEMEVKAAEIYEASRQTIQDRYSDLRLGLEQGVQAIEQEREPTLTEVAEQKMEQTAEAENPMFSLAAYRKLAEANPEAAKELSQQMQPQRSQEQEYQR